MCVRERDGGGMEDSERDREKESEKQVVATGGQKYGRKEAQVAPLLPSFCKNICLLHSIPNKGGCHR